MADRTTPLPSTHAETRLNEGGAPRPSLRPSFSAAPAGQHPLIFPSEDDTKEATTPVQERQEQEQKPEQEPESKSGSGCGADLLGRPRPDPPAFKPRPIPKFSNVNTVLPERVDALTVATTAYRTVVALVDDGSRAYPPGTIYTSVQVAVGWRKKGQSKKLVDKTSSPFANTEQETNLVPQIELIPGGRACECDGKIHGLDATLCPTCQIAWLDPDYALARKLVKG
jgi:hypothetical protein